MVLNRVQASLAVPKLLAALAMTAVTMVGQTLSLPPAELVARAVQNEIQSSGNGPKHMFRDRKQNPNGSQTKLLVETREAMAGILIAVNDKPLTPEERQAEAARVERFLKDPEELTKRRRQEQENAEHINRIVKALPEAFLYEYDGSETGAQGVGRPGDPLVRLTFRPNPNYQPPSRVEQVLTGMRGYLLIDAVEYRIARVDGTLEKDVGFGWGILGHLDRGGHFLVEQGKVGSGNDWAITRMDVAFTGKALLFKNLNFKWLEVFTDFHSVPPNLTFAQGLELLKKQEALLAQNDLQ
jgi:hypothetical protein